MGLSFTNSWLGVLLNPIGYSAQHVSVETAADDYAGEHPPSSGIDLDTVTEIRLKEARQQYIDACTASLKSRDVGYSKANCAGACAGKFDQDPINEEVANAIAARAEAEKVALQEKIQKNGTTILIIIAAFIITGILLYLFLS